MRPGEPPRPSRTVEVADNLPGVVAVRDSKDPAGPALAFAPGAWRAFVTHFTDRP
ncbi:DUF397 domain-containing protein [Micromonospora sp. WMMD1082]|uniref:DUF397 domain-containing protein n=1 Tax=Micromonospora sp. WMMD1082 TaxID=3016104 RepID=UPI00241636D0|nr:DUF397 domain-containing protein [Micromonospora sp. WMMD1082]MDG4796264.1 DUF397 domain-containing protein [Micromonospora sp. WMMD1082]